VERRKRNNDSEDRGQEEAERERWFEVGREKSKSVVGDY